MKIRHAHRFPTDLYIATGARALSILANVVAVTALLLTLHDQGAGSWAVAGVLAAGALPIVLCAPIVGAAVDRYDSRTLIVVSSLWQAGSCVLLAFVVQPYIVLPLVALNACGTAVTNPVFLALTRMMVSDRQLAMANSMQQGVVTIATLAGPAVSGLLTGLTGGARVPLLLNAGIFVVIAGAGVLIATRRRALPGGCASRARDGITVLFGDPALLAVVLLVALLPPVVHLIYVAQVFLVRDTYGASALAFGLLQASQMVGLLIGTVGASFLNTARRILLGSPLSAVVMSVAIALIGVVRSLPVTFVLYLVAGVAMSMVSVPIATMLLLRVPESKLGRATASFTAVHRAASLVAYGLGGLMVGLFPPDLVYLLSGTSSLIIVLALVPALRRAWEATRQPLVPIRWHASAESPHATKVQLIPAAERR